MTRRRGAYFCYFLLPAMELDYRYERKFRVEAGEASLPEVLAAVRLHSAGFRVAWPDRLVTSLYLDTPDRQAFYANVAGLAERAKPRLRWYAPAPYPVAGGSHHRWAGFEQPQDKNPARLEIKRRHGLVGTKELLALPAWPPPPGPGAWRTYTAGHPWLARHPQLEPAVLVAYRRSYLVSADGRIRLTLDQGLRYAPASPDLRPAQPGTVVPDPALVLELKYPVAAAAATAHLTLPFRLTRNSKYVSAVLLTQ